MINHNNVLLTILLSHYSLSNKLFKGALFFECFCYVPFKKFKVNVGSSSFQNKTNGQILKNFKIAAVVTNTKGFSSNINCTEQNTV